MLAGLDDAEPNKLNIGYLSLTKTQNFSVISCLSPFNYTNLPCPGLKLPPGCKHPRFSLFRLISITCQIGANIFFSSFPANTGEPSSKIFQGQSLSLMDSTGVSCLSCSLRSHAASPFRKLPNQNLIAATQPGPGQTE